MDCRTYFYIIESRQTKTADKKAMEIFSYKWTASINGEVINEGVRELSTEKMLDHYGITNLHSLVNEWNRMAAIQNPSGIVWRYEVDGEPVPKTEKEKVLIVVADEHTLGYIFEDGFGIKMLGIYRALVDRGATWELYPCPKMLSMYKTIRLARPEDFVVYKVSEAQFNRRDLAVYEYVYDRG